MVSVDKAEVRPRFPHRRLTAAVAACVAGIARPVFYRLTGAARPSPPTASRRWRPRRAEASSSRLVSPPPRARRSTRRACDARPPPSPPRRSSRQRCGDARAANAFARKVKSRLVGARRSRRRKSARIPFVGKRTACLVKFLRHFRARTVLTPSTDDDPRATLPRARARTRRDSRLRAGRVVRDAGNVRRRALEPRRRLDRVSPRSRRRRSRRRPRRPRRPRRRRSRGDSTRRSTRRLGRVRDAAPGRGCSRNGRGVRRSRGPRRDRVGTRLELRDARAEIERLERSRSRRLPRTTVGRRRPCRQRPCRTSEATRRTETTNTGENTDEKTCASQDLEDGGSLTGAPAADRLSPSSTSRGAPSRRCAAR